MKGTVKPYLASSILYDTRRQKEYEKDVFMDFALKMGIAEFKIQQPNPPEPDIVVSILNSEAKEINIGCELKDLYWDKEKKGSVQKKRFEKWKYFARKLRTDLDNLNNGFEYLYGVIGLKNMDILNSKPNQEALSREIIQLLNANRLPINTRFEDFSKHHYLSENIEHLRVETYPERGILWWETSLLSGQTVYDTDFFQKEILQKHSKKHNFDNCNKKWLILFAEGNNLGNSVSFPFDQIEKLKITNEHKFDKVYYFNRFDESICQLYPTVKKIFEVTNSGDGIRYKTSLTEI